MSSIDPSMEPMLEMFIYESTTLLEQLDEILLESEKSKNISEDNINEIFRIMHTIKGSSAMMGLENISNLAHAVEDVFFIIRETPGKMKLLGEALFDIVFQASDYLKAEVEGVQGDEYQPKDPGEMIRQLENQVAIMNGQAVPEAPADAAAPEPEAAAQEEDDIQQVRIFFEDGCQMENIRGFMLLSQLKDWCDYLDSVPPHPENDASLSAEIIKNGFLVKFRPSNTVEDVYKVIENAINIKSYEPIENTAPVSHPAKQPQAAASAPQPDGTPAAPAPSDEAPVPVKGQAPAPAKEEAQAPAATSNMITAKSNKQSLISVNQSKLDLLMDLVGELVTTESMVASSPDLKGLILDNFNKSTRELRKLTDELQEVVMSIRMVPLAGVFQKMNRIVRDMSRKLGKEVELVTMGGETEVDKTINDSITDPFMHMIRNSMDHAIEPLEERVALGKPEVGRITISAQNVGGEIVINISDDGCGLDTDRILKKARANGLLFKPEAEYTPKEIFGMIMLPGFSTNEQVTEFSGRGVGMDVVRKNIEKCGGTISVESEQNVGTTFTIKIPLTLAIVEGMEISVGDTLFTLPVTSIRSSMKISDEEQIQIIHNTDGTEMIMIRGECYPIIRLHAIYNLPTQVTDLSEGIVIQVESGHQVACIFADELIGQQQVVVKPFPQFLSRYNIKKSGLSGCTILGDGSISLILDANSLLSVYQ